MMPHAEPASRVHLNPCCNTRSTLNLTMCVHVKREARFPVERRWPSRSTHLGTNSCLRKACSCIHPSIQAWMHTYIQTFMHASLHACIHTYLHASCLLAIPTYLLTYLPAYLPAYHAVASPKNDHLSKSNIYISLSLSLSLFLNVCTCI